MINMDDPQEVETARRFLDRLAKRALAMEGTCTGEHGIGQGKIKYLEAEHGIEALAAMRAVKQALDPQGIMNPGKVGDFAAGH
jgi:D-lactate dehydrogenase (cytochrome)